MTLLRGGLCSLVLALVVGSGLAVAGTATAPVDGGGRLFNMESSVPVTLYGHVKLDAAYQDSRLNADNFADYVLSESPATTEDDDEFQMTANQTRLGLNLGGLEAGSIKVSGKVEVDFFGDAAATNKPKLLLRQAYLQLDWEEYDLSLRAGQTSDLVSPLMPSTLNYCVMRWQGNAGCRRPQIRLTKGFNLEGAVERVEIAVAATRNIGPASVEHDDSGEDSGTPGLQARLGVKFKLLTEKSTVLGISGSLHSEEYDTAVDDENTDYDSNMVCVDLTLPLLDWLTLKGEFYKGENVSTFLVGVGQGVNVAGDTEIESAGGWIAATITPPGAMEDWTFNIGYGVDDPAQDDLAGGNISRNVAIFGNAIYNLGGGVSMGLEVMNLETEYNGADDDGDAVRVQLSVIYKF